MKPMKLIGRIQDEESYFSHDETYLTGLVREVTEVLKDYVGLGRGDCKTSELQLRKPCTLQDYETCLNYKGKKIPICPYCPYKGNVGRGKK